MLQNYWKFPNRNVQTYGFVYHDTNGLKHGPVSNTQSFLLSEIYLVILWQDYYEKGNLRKSYWSTFGRRFHTGNAYSYTVKKGYSYLCMWMTSNWLERNKTLIWCGRYWIKKLIWENQHLSWIMYTWRVLKDNVKYTMLLLTITEPCLNPEFPQEQLKNYHDRKIFESLRGHMTWKDMPRNVWNDIVSWQTRRLNNSTKYQLHVLMTIISKKKNWNPWENCQKYDLKLFWNVCIWHVLEDLIFYGQWTNLHDRSKNGPKRVTNDYLVWSLTFIIHVNTNNIAMWETLPNNADWDYFKTPILQEILRIQNLHQVEHCAFSEVIRLFQSVGCVRNKLQFRTVQQNQKSFPWTQDWGWTVYPHLIYGIWSSQFLMETRIRVIKNGATRART